MLTKISNSVAIDLDPFKVGHGKIPVDSSDHIMLKNETIPELESTQECHSQKFPFG